MGHSILPLYSSMNAFPRAEISAPGAPLGVLHPLHTCKSGHLGQDTTEGVPPSPRTQVLAPGYSLAHREHQLLPWLPRAPLLVPLCL